MSSNPKPTTENPYESISVPAEPNVDSDPQEISTEHAAYNVVSDTVTGLNFRKSDNKFQALCILVSVLVAAVIGAILALMIPSWKLPWIGGAVIGSFAGLIIGVLGSGTFLMIFRAVKHMQGKHE